MALHSQVPQADDMLDLNPMYTLGSGGGHVPKHRLPEGELHPISAYRVVHDELMLDGNARLNLATFVTTWMEDEAKLLIAETLEKNMIDKDEYPQTAEIERRCVSMLADLWHARDLDEALGTSTIGSSEAAMLAGLAMKWRWRDRMRAAGKPTDRPNLVTGANVQICWEKFARYWDVELRLVPMEGERRHLTPDQAAARCDENTIGVVSVLGSTFDGSYEPVREIAAALDQLQEDKGIDVPLHVDGASGGFIAPFLEPELEWDFRVPRVVSINASGHKYGLVYPGVGWAVWRDRSAVPDDLIFHVNYLGGDMPTFTLNFSRPGNQVIAQYYIFLRLGFAGYRRVQQVSREVAMYLADEVERAGPFVALTRGNELPAFAFTLRDDVDTFTVFDVSEGLRSRGWQVPAYTMPPNLEDLAVLRMVVRNGMSRDMADLLLDDLRRVVEHLRGRGRPTPASEARVAYHH